MPILVVSLAMCDCRPCKINFVKLCGGGGGGGCDAADLTTVDDVWVGKVGTEPLAVSCEFRS